MKKLIYINLFIDNEWDHHKILDTIFSLRVPSSKTILDSYYLWGIFRGNTDDYAIVKELADNEFVLFLNKHLELPIQIKNDDISSLDLNRLSNFEFVGISNEEESLISLKPNIRKKYLKEDDYRILNSKTILLELAEAEGINFPKTKIISVENFSELANTPRPFVLKFNHSAGGRGVFVINDKSEHLPAFIARQLDDINESAVFLKQEYIDIKSHFYTIANTESEVIAGYEIVYDSSNNSKIHKPEKIIHKSRIEASAKISEYLRSQNYHGPFGFDGFIDTKEKIYPAIDLNVRLDKSRMIYDLACKLKIENENYEFRRERFQSVGYSGFTAFWQVRIEGLNGINNKYGNKFRIFPVMFANLFRSNKEIDTVEISFFFINTNEENIESFEEWKNNVYEWLGITTQGDL